MGLQRFGHNLVAEQKWDSFSGESRLMQRIITLNLSIPPSSMSSPSIIENGFKNYIFKNAL